MRRISGFLFFCAAVVFFASLFISPALGIEDEVAATLTEENRKARLEWWQDARLGLFVHWGLYAVPAGRWQGKRITGPGEQLLGEWIMWNAKIPVAQYELLANQFNPTQYNAEQWVKLAKQAGMKYIVITAKHCEGFAMYQSDVSTYNIVDGTPFDRDPLAELKKACDKHGLKLGFYYSHVWDWHEPNARGLDNRWDWPDRDAKDPNLYFEKKAYPQIKELLQKYDPAIIWFDVPADITREQSERFLSIIRKHNPACIINDRIGNDLGDYESPEQYIPSATDDKDFEVCMTLNDSWGYMIDNVNWKSPTTVIRNLVDIASKGGNYLVNVGPTAEGLFPPASVRILQEVGKWMNRYGESIYQTSANPLGNLGQHIRCTAKKDKLYIHVFNWPENDELVLPAIQNKIQKVYLLADKDKKPLPVVHDRKTAVTIELNSPTLPPHALDAANTVLVIQCEGTPKAASQATLVDRTYAITFHSALAVIHGETLSYNVGSMHGLTDRNRLVDWTDPDEYIRWPIQSIRNGHFEVEITYAAAASADSEFVIEIGDQKLTARVVNTGSESHFKTFSVGTLLVPDKVKTDLTLRPVRIKNGSLMNLRSIKLIPTAP